MIHQRIELCIKGGAKIVHSSLSNCQEKSRERQRAMASELATTFRTNVELGYRRHILPYWKTWVVIFTPLFLLPLCVVANTPVRILNLFKFIEKQILKILIFLGSENGLCHPPHVGLLGVECFAVGCYQSPSDRPLPADGRHGNERSVRSVF